MDSQLCPYFLLDIYNLFFFLQKSSKISDFTSRVIIVNKN